MEKKSGNISLGTAICLFIIILLIIALAGIYYLGFIKNKEQTSIAINTEKEVEATSNIENTVKSSDITDKDDIKTVVLTSDLVTLDYMANNESTSIFYAYIENGYLYYFYECTDGDLEGRAYDFDADFSPLNSEIKKYNQINNFKIMKKFNIGTGIKPVLFLIAEDGKVYTLDYLDSLEIELYEGLKDYKVEDIISKTGELYSIFEILLKDGTTKTVKICEVEIND